MTYERTFVELFAGCGGFRLGLEQAGWTCLWANDIDKYACQVYRKNFRQKKVTNNLPECARDRRSPQSIQGHGIKPDCKEPDTDTGSGKYLSEQSRSWEHIRPNGVESDNQVQRTTPEQQEHMPKDCCSELIEGDIRTIDPNTIPDHTLLTAGFPCQPFSIAGKRGGFEDTRGTLFHEICRVAKVKRPKFLLLENVKGLLNHEGGKTFGIILSALDELGYDVQWAVLNSRDFGLPQNRERVFFICYLREECG